jgi:glycosyltransferase involved in cell wall biosynthesis
MDGARAAGHNAAMAQAEPMPPRGDEILGDATRGDAAAVDLAGRTVLQVVPALDAGGVERTAVDVARAVAQAGGRSLVVSAGGRLERELEAAGVEALRLPLDTRSPADLLHNAQALRRLIIRERIDVVHARSRLPAWAALWAARRTGAAFVTTYAGIYNARSRLKRAYNGVMARGDVVIANSEFTRAHLLAQHGADTARVVAIPRGLDLARFDPAAVSAERVSKARAAFGRLQNDPRTVLLLAGRLTRWKGQALAIEALARAVGRGGDLGLVLVGDDQGRTAYREELTAAAARLGVADRVRLVGHWDDMPAAYLACDAALAPSLEPEAFGRTAVEPQAMGRPVLAADHGGARETVQDGVTGLRATPGDLDAWTEALLTAARWSPAERAAMGEAGRAWVRPRFSVQAMTAATLQVYAGLLAGRARR